MNRTDDVKRELADARNAESTQALQPHGWLRLVLLLAVLLCLAQGTMQAQHWYFPPEVYPVMQYNEPLAGGKGLGAGLAALDMNRDGRKDVLVGAETSNEIYVFLTGPGLLDSIPDLVLRGGGNMVVGDLNGDGLPDLVAHNYSSYSIRHRDSVFVYFGRAGGHWATDTVPALIILGTSDPYDRFGLSMAIGDLNADGFDDLVVGEFLFHANLEKGINGRVNVFLGRTQFRNESDFSGSHTRDSLDSYATTVAIGDVNGDGIKDLLVGGNQQVGTAGLPYCDLFKGRSGWDFDASKPDQHLTNLALNPDPGGDRPSFAHPCLADANNDGAEDIITLGDFVEHGFLLEKWCYYGGPALFPDIPSKRIRSWEVNLDYTYYTFEIGDINGDGLRDYMTPMLESHQYIALTIQLGDRDSIIATPRRMYMHDGFRRGIFFADRARATELGDIDGDGVCDYAMSLSGELARQPLGWIGVFLGDRSISTGVHGITERSSAGELICGVFPNPAPGAFTVTLSLQQSRIIDIRLVDALGRAVRDMHPGLLPPGEHLFQINTSDLSTATIPAGVYFLQVHDGYAINSTRVLLTQ